MTGCVEEGVGSRDVVGGVCGVECGRRSVGASQPNPGLYNSVLAPELPQNQAARTRQNLHFQAGSDRVTSIRKKDQKSPSPKEMVKAAGVH